MCWASATAISANHFRCNQCQKNRCNQLNQCNHENMIKTISKQPGAICAATRPPVLINIGGLSVGMAAAVLIFIWVQNEFNFDKTSRRVPISTV
jgi:hypothetical protein